MAKRKSAEQVRALLRGVASDRAKGQRVGQACRKQGKYVGICGQGPSDYPDLAEWLMAEGIESMSLNPDTVVETWMRLAKREAASSV